MRMLKSITTNQEPLRQLISIVITEFYLKLDENGKKAISDKIGYAEAKSGSRMGAQFALSQYVATRIITDLRTSKAMSRLIRVASGFTINILLLQGIIEEAARAPRRMREKYPVAYVKSVCHEFRYGLLSRRTTTGTIPVIYQQPPSTVQRDRK